MTLKHTIQDSIKELQEPDRVTITDGDHEVDVRTNYQKDEPTDLYALVVQSQGMGLDPATDRAQPIAVDKDGNTAVVTPAGTTLDMNLAEVNGVAIAASAPVPVSATMAANAVTNPIAVRVSVDGTNGMDATHPLVISGTASANAATNPIATRLSQDGTNFVDATHPLEISATAAANAATNPIHTRLSVDGTNPMDATHPVIVSGTASANAATNPIHTRVSVDGTNPMDATHPLVISGTASANALTNPIAVRVSADGTNANAQAYPVYAAVSKDTAANTASNPIHGNLATIGSGPTAIAVNSGNLSDGVQRVTLCNDGVVGACQGTVGSAVGTKGLVVLGADGTSVNRTLPIVVDGATASVNLVQIGGVDGTNAQIQKMDINGQSYVLVGTWPAAFDDPNAWVETRNYGSNSTTLTGTATVAGNDQAVLASTDVSAYKEVSIVISNSGASLTDSIVYASNDGTVWVSLAPTYGTLETTAKTIATATSAIAFYSDDFPFKYIKYNASCATSTSLTYYFFARC